MAMQTQVLLFASIAVHALSDDSCFGVIGRECDQGITVNHVIGNETNQRDYYNAASHYDTLFGKDNFHHPYFPHISGESTVTLNFSQAATMLTHHLISFGKIDATSRVLDLGAGKGTTCRDIALITGASCTGIDLTENNIARASQIKDSHPGLELDFSLGSFTDLPDAIAAKPFTHVISLVAFCHVHKLLSKIFDQVYRVLKHSGGVAVLNDFLGGDNETSSGTREHVHKRLHFSELKGHKAWRKAAEDAGLVLQKYENLDLHITHGHRLLAEQAEKHGLLSADGIPLATHYRETVRSGESREIGMNLAVYSV